MIDEIPQNYQSIRTSDQRDLGLEIPNIGRESLPFLLANVGGIADDQVKPLVCGECGKERSLAEFESAFQLVAIDIAASDFESPRIDIDRHSVRLRAMKRDGDRDC